MSRNYQAAQLSEFEEVLEDAEIRALNEKEMNFVSDMRTRYERWGGSAFISQAQWDWLKKIANSD